MRDVGDRADVARGRAPGASIVIGRSAPDAAVAAPRAARSRAAGARNGTPKAAAISRAMPGIDRQSGRFAVTSKSRSASVAVPARCPRARGRASTAAADRLGRFVDVDELADPRQQDLHRPNCSRKRRSFS